VGISLKRKMVAFTLGREPFTMARIRR